MLFLPKSAQSISFSSLFLVIVGADIWATITRFSICYLYTNCCHRPQRATKIFHIFWQFSVDHA